MTDRISHLVVVLEEGIRDEDAEPLIKAIGQIRGVAGVTPEVDNLHVARMQVRNETFTAVTKAVADALFPEANRG